MLFVSIVMDTYCTGLRRRINREVASYQKRKTVKYFQFPQRPETRGRPFHDEDQTDPFMFRTNTRLSFRPFSRYLERINAGKNFQKSIKQLSLTIIKDLIMTTDCVLMLVKCWVL